MARVIVPVYLVFASLLAAAASRLPESVALLSYCYYVYRIYLGVLETELAGVSLWGPGDKTWRRLWVQKPATNKKKKKKDNTVYIYCAKVLLMICFIFR